MSVGMVKVIYLVGIMLILLAVSCTQVPSQTPKESSAYATTSSSIIGQTSSPSPIPSTNPQPTTESPIVSTEKYMLTTSSEPAGAGIITPDINIYESGSTVAVNATSLPGYKFDYWSGDIESMSSSITVIMKKKMSIIAHFKTLYRLDISVYPEGTGTTFPSTNFYIPGNVVAVEATPGTGFGFDHWSGDIENNNNPQSLVMDKNKNLIAHFHPAVIDIQEGKDKGLISVTASGSDFLDSINVKITSNCKSSPITVNIQPGTVFVLVFLIQERSRMINLQKTSISVDPGTSQHVLLHTASIDSGLMAPDETTELYPKDTPLPSDTKLLLQASDFQSASFRIQQFAIWLTTSNTWAFTKIRVGSKGNYQSVTEDELKQIKSIFQNAGISIDKYPVLFRLEDNKK
jgi:hypothetical protein